MTEELNAISQLPPKPRDNQLNTPSSTNQSPAAQRLVKAVVVGSKRAYQAVAEAAAGNDEASKC